MPREPRSPLFKKPDLSKLIELAKKKGLPNYRIEIRHDGLTLIVGEAAKANENSNSEVENWIAQHEHQS